jgi:actin-related protein
LFPINQDSIPRLICDSIMKCENESQANLFSSMIICGGIASFENLPDRLRNEVEKVVHSKAPGVRVKCISSGANERSVCSWLGGSILASLGTFHEMWLSRQEYDEYGPSIIDRKCP